MRAPSSEHPAPGDDRRHGWRSPHLCDQCAHERGLATHRDGGGEPVDVVEGETVGCFPDLYAALSGNMPDQVISL